MIKKIFSVALILPLLIFLLFIGSDKLSAAEGFENLVIDGGTVYYRGTSNPVQIPTSYNEKNIEFRGVWASPVSGDVGRATNQDTYKNQIDALITMMLNYNMNALIFHVRSHNDAYYDSELAPWSSYISSGQGVSVGWDPMRYVIDACHENGIEFHAWMNPYRVTVGTTDKETQLSKLDDDNFAKKNPGLVMADKSGKLILNPGEPEVQNYIIDVIDEFMGLYPDVDGLHFDDYFYSYSGHEDSEDAATYTTYGGGMTKADWKRNNVNTLMRRVYETITNFNSENGTHLRFGISPFGIWKNGNGTISGGSKTAGNQSYSVQFADSKKWVEEGWVDYICPQTYWSFRTTAAPFADLIDWWALVCSTYGVDLVLGAGLYMINEGIAAWSHDSELGMQLRYASQYDIVKGHSIFSYKTMKSGTAIVAG